MKLYRPEIDGLRAFAVVSVIINHFNKEILPGGYLGVDIFFVISGFVITSSLFGRRSKDFRDFIIGFYERRIKRIVPALAAYVLIASFAICLFNQSPGISLKTGMTSLFGFSNLFLLNRSVDYFAQSTDLNVFTQTWSLGVEEQFYTLFPLLVWFSGFVRNTKNGGRNLFFLVGTLAIASLIGFLYLYPINQPAAYFSMPTRFWEMATGCLLFILYEKKVSFAKYFENIPPFFILFLTLGVMYLPASLGSVSTVLIVFLSAVLIGALKKDTLAFVFFTKPKVVYIGLISYPLYLWHWGVLSISRWTIGIHWWSIPLQIGLIFGLAIISYNCIEIPIRKGNLFEKRWMTLAFGSGILVFLSGLLITFNDIFSRFLFLGPKETYEWGTIPKTGINTDCYTSGEKNDYIIKSNKCFIDYTRTQNLLKQKKPKFVLVGDSHARHHVYLLKYLAEEFSAEGVFLRCDNVSIPPIIEDFSRKEVENYKCGIRLLERLKEESKDSQLFVILSSRWSSMFFQEYVDLINRESMAGPLKNYPNSFSKLSALESFIEDLENLVKQLSEENSYVILLDSLPEFGGFIDKPVQEYGSLCNPSWFNFGIQSKPPCVSPKAASQDREFLIKRMSNFTESLSKLQKRNSNLKIFNQFNVLCPESLNACTTKDTSGNELYLDDDHITEYSSVSIAEALANKLRSWDIFAESDDAN